jgi:hypothetical protein
MIKEKASSNFDEVFKILESNCWKPIYKLANEFSKSRKNSVKRSICIIKLETEHLEECF